MCAAELSEFPLTVHSRQYSARSLLKDQEEFSESGSEKGVFWKRGLFRKVHFLEILENLEILEFLENSQTVERKGDSDHFLEILENLEILDILEISRVKRPLS